MRRFICFFLAIAFTNLVASTCAKADIRSIEISSSPYTYVNKGNKCYSLKKVRAEENGFINLTFITVKMMISGIDWYEKDCAPRTIYNASTKPENSIRGARGVKGKKPEPSFNIQVTPNTKLIILKVLEKNVLKEYAYSIGTIV